MEIQMALKKSKELADEVKYLFKDTNYKQYNDLSGLKYEEGNVEDEFIRTQLVAAYEHLEMAKYKIDYINRNIVETGKLKLNSLGKYELNEHEYSSGSLIEFLFYDDFLERDCWVISRIESTDRHYYIVGFRNLQLEGLLVRRRELAPLYK